MATQHEGFALVRVSDGAVLATFNSLPALPVRVPGKRIEWLTPVVGVPLPEIVDEATVESYVLAERHVEQAPTRFHRAGDTPTVSFDGTKVNVNPNWVGGGLAAAKKIVVGQVKREAKALLSATDWYAIRAAEGGTAVPQAVRDYRNGVRARAQTLEDTINGAANLPTLAAILIDGWPDPLQNGD